MKKLISVEHLTPGMFIEAEVVTEEKDGEEQKFLHAKNSVSTGSNSKRARLTGRMYEKIEEAGGLRISSEGLVGNLRKTGLTMVTIDTEKGDDLPETVQPITDPNRKPPPEGRLVHFDEEIERAKEARAETTETLKQTMADIQSGEGMDVEKVQSAGDVISESIMRNVDIEELMKDIETRGERTERRMR